MLYREIIAVCSQIHTKHINTPCGQNVELLYVKRGGTYCNHWLGFIILPAKAQQTHTHTHRISCVECA